MTIVKTPKSLHLQLNSQIKIRNVYDYVILTDILRYLAGYVACQRIDLGNILTCV